MKLCPKCNTEKKPSEFHKDKKGSQGLFYMCKACRKEHDRRFYQENGTKKKLATKKRIESLTKFVSDYKEQKGCQYCGECEPCCLDLHHTDPKQKEDAVANMARRFSLEKIKAEIAKCVVLCANCHRKVHAGKLGPS